MSLSDQDIRNIQAISDKFMDVFKDGAYNEVDTLYTEDAVVMPPDQGAVTGRGEIRTFMESFPPMVEFKNVVDEISGEGGMAYVRGHFRMVMAPEPGGEPVVSEGKYLEIRKKQPDGSWPVTHDIFTPGV